MMEYTRVFTDSNGDSHFEIVPVVMEEKSEFGFFWTPNDKLKSLHFQNAMPHHEWDFMNVPNKVFIIIIDGSLELDASDGTRKTFKQGDIILLDDQSGKGHKVKTFESTVSVVVIHCD